MHTYKNYLKEEKLDLTPYAIDDSTSDNDGKDVILIHYNHSGYTSILKFSTKIEILIKSDSKNNMDMNKIIPFSELYKQYNLDTILDLLKEDQSRLYIKSRNMRIGMVPLVDYSKFGRISTTDTVFNVVPLEFYNFILKFRTAQDIVISNFYMRDSFRNVFEKYTKSHPDYNNKQFKDYPAAIFFQKYHQIIKNKDLTAQDGGV